MNYQEKEVFKLKKELVCKEEEHKRERNMFQQKIELLTAQISDYQEKQMKNRQLNESIIMGYRQNQSFREQFTQKELQSISNQYQEELKMIKLRHKEEKKQLQGQLQSLRCQNQTLRTQIDRQRLEFEKRAADMKHEWEQKLTTSQKELAELFTDKLNVMTEKLRQTEDMCRLYRDQLELGLGNTLKGSISSYPEHQNQIENYEPGNKVIQDVITRKKPLSAQQESISSLSMRINRVLSQVNPNQVRIQQKIREIKGKKY